MKKLVAAMGLLAALATPVLAQGSHIDARQSHAREAAAPADAVVVGGKVVGQDPDLNVRLELKRDAYVSEY